MASRTALDRSLTVFSERLDRIRQDLYYCDALALHPGRRDVATGIEAGTYIWLAAALEAVVNDLLSATLNEINVQRLPLRDTRLSLFALTRAPEHDSLQQVRGLKMWQRRAEIHVSIESAQPCVLALDRLPLDGRTIRPQHLETVWAVFGFSGDPTRSSLHRLALNDLAAARNELAHGGEQVGAVAGRKTRQELLRLVELVEDLALNLWEVCEHYIDTQGFKR